MTFDPHTYTITTKKLDRDGDPVFKATVAELPNLATYEDSPEAAYAAIIEDIQALHEMALKHGSPFPEPMGDRAEEYTGRVTLRLPRTLHHRLVDQSLREDVSLNTYLVCLLSEASAAKVAGAIIASTVETNVRAALAATQLMTEIGGGKAVAVYSATEKVRITSKEHTWTKLH